MPRRYVSSESESDGESDYDSETSQYSTSSDESDYSENSGLTGGNGLDSEEEAIYETLKNDKDLNKLAPKEVAVTAEAEQRTKLLPDVQSTATTKSLGPQIEPAQQSENEAQTEPTQKIYSFFVDLEIPKHDRDISKYVRFVKLNADGKTYALSVQNGQNVANQITTWLQNKQPVQLDEPKVLENTLRLVIHLKDSGKEHLDISDVTKIILVGIDQKKIDEATFDKNTNYEAQLQTITNKVYQYTTPKPDTDPKPPNIAQSIGNSFSKVADYIGDKGDSVQASLQESLHKISSAASHGKDNTGNQSSKAADYTGNKDDSAQTSLQGSVQKLFSSNKDRTVKGGRSARRHHVHPKDRHKSRSNSSRRSRHHKSQENYENLYNQLFELEKKL